MRQSIEGLFRSYGSTVSICKGKSKLTIRAFLQPITSRNWMNIEHLFKSGGEIPRGRYIYIGPASAEIVDCDYMQMDQKRFRVRRTDTVYMGDTALYRWALCVEGGYDEAWND